MGNFPLTRIALNLSLIVAMAIQPVAACATMAACSVRCSASPTLMCPGCGCCEAGRADDRCGCCCGAENVELENEAEPGCCSHDRVAATEGFDSQVSSSDTAIAVGELSSAADACGVESVCLCDRNPQPLSDSSPERPTNGGRTSLAPGFTSPFGADDDPRQTLLVARAGTDVPALAHFSQILFCIWRL